MNPREYRELDRVEALHWFYRGKREIVRYWLRRFQCLTKESLLVDCGANTGLFAREMESSCRVAAIDYHDESLQIAARTLGPDRVKRGCCTALPLADQSVDCLTALDVLEHIENDRSAMSEFARVLKPGGVAVFTVPAMKGLWSDWDLSLHHFRRYSRREFLKLLRRPEFELLHWNHTNVLALPIIACVRKLRAFRKAGQRAFRLEDCIPPEPLNTALRLCFATLACQSWVSFPFGAGLLGVVRRR
jgi:ubiquinone/menaquinone biosynthesis C-methylase UbiE